MQAENIQERSTFTRRQMAEARLATWHGRTAHMNGLDGVKDNPHNGWQDTQLKQHSHQCLLWSRWLLGWLREHFKNDQPNEAGGSHE